MTNEIAFGFQVGDDVSDRLQENHCAESTYMLHLRKETRRPRGTLLLPLADISPMRHSVRLFCRMQSFPFITQGSFALKIRIAQSPVQFDAAAQSLY